MPSKPKNENVRSFLIASSARGDARLHRVSRLIDVAERIRCWDVAVAQATNALPWEAVAPRLRDKVDDTSSGGLPIFGLIAVRELPELDCVLRAADRTPLVESSTDSVINVDQVAAGALPADVQSRVKLRQMLGASLAQSVKLVSAKLRKFGY